MHDSDLVTELIRRCHTGDRDAFDRLFERYASRLARIAEQHLNYRVARREGPEDVVQSVFRTFFRRCTEAGLVINDATHLWHLLVHMTVLKVRAKARYHSADMRNIEAEVSGEDAWLAQATDREPGPEEAAALLDLMEAMVRGLNPIHAQILELLVQGYSVAEIAQQLGRTRQSIYRVRELLEERVKRASGDTPGSL